MQYLSTGIAALMMGIMGFFGFQSATQFGAGPSVLKVQQGGTGASTFTVGDCLVGNGTSPITTQPCSAGGGEANTGGSLGTGLNIYDSKSGVQLRFNTLAAGSNITLSTTTNDNTIVIASTASGGTGFSTTSADYYRSVTGRVATSAAETAGQLPYWTSSNANPATLGGIATGTVSSSGGITTTASRYVLNGALAISCDVASGSIPGCLSAADWTTFNNKASFGYPFPSNATTSVLTFSTGTIQASSTVGNLTATSTFALPVSGLLKGNGVSSAVTAGANGTDFTLISAQTCSAGQHVSAISASGAVTCSADTDLFAYPFPNNATSTALTFNGGLTSATSTSGTLNAGSITATSSYRGAGLTADCDTAATSKLLWDITTGQFSCGTDQTGAGGGAYPFTPTTNLGVLTQATTGIPFFQNGFQASSTSYLTNASSSILTSKDIYSARIRPNVPGSSLFLTDTSFNNYVELGDTYISVYSSNSLVFNSDGTMTWSASGADYKFQGSPAVYGIEDYSNLTTVDRTFSHPDWSGEYVISTSTTQVSSITATSTSASSTFQAGAYFGGSVRTNILGCNTTQKIATNGSGYLFCDTDATGGGSASSTLLTDFNTWDGQQRFRADLRFPSGLGTFFFTSTDDSTIYAGLYGYNTNQMAIQGANGFSAILDLSLITQDKIIFVPDLPGTLCIKDGNCAATTTSNTWAGTQTFDNLIVTGTCTGCGTGTSLDYTAWGGSIASTYGTTTIASTTPAWFKMGVYASSTSQLKYASSTALTVSGKIFTPNIATVDQDSPATITVKGGDTTLSGGTGAIAILQAGAGLDSGAGGIAEIKGGNGGETGNGGGIDLDGGFGGGLGGNGGPINLYAGDASDGNSTGGDITFNTGAGAGTGINGRYIFNAADAPFDAYFYFNQLVTAVRSYFYPNVSGTVAVGVATTSSGVAYWGTDSGLYSGATTTLVAGTNISFSATPVILGSSPITISASGGGSSFGQAFELNSNGLLAPTTTKSIAINGSATSTFAAGVEAPGIGTPWFSATSTTATSTVAFGLNVGQLNQTGTATSTFARGITLANGCFAIGVNCLQTIYSIGTGLSLSGGALTNTGIISASCSGGTVCSGTNPLSISSFSYPWTNTTYGTSLAAATTTTIKFADATIASSTIGNLQSGALTATSSFALPVSGVLKGNGVTSAVTAAANGTDFTLISATTCGGTDKVSAISASGAVTCSADQTGGGSSFGQAWEINTNGLLAPTTTKSIAVTGTATSTFSKGVEASAIGTPVLYATSTSATSSFAWGVHVNALNIIGTATTTSNWGITIANGCYALNNTCNLNITSVGTGLTFTSGALSLNQAANLTWTGSHDFGGASALEVPNGTSFTFSATGQVYYDTTDNQWQIGTTSANSPRAVPTITRLWSGTVASSSVDFVSGGRIPLYPHRDGVVITEINCVVDGGTSKAINIDTLAGGSNTDGLTCATTNTSDTSMSANYNITAGTPMALEFGATTGSVDYVTFAVWGYIQPE